MRILNSEYFDISFVFLIISSGIKINIWQIYRAHSLFYILPPSFRACIYSSLKFTTDSLSTEKKKLVNQRTAVVLVIVDQGVFILHSAFFSYLVLIIVPPYLQLGLHLISKNCVFFTHIGGRRMSERDLPSRVMNEPPNQNAQLPIHAPIHSSKSVPSLNSPCEYFL